MPELKNPKHELFAVLVARGEHTLRAAYTTAGFKAKSGAVADGAAGKLIRRPMVEDRIRELRTTVYAQLGMTVTDIIKRLHAISFTDATDVVEWKTNRKGETVIKLKDSSKLSEAARASIKSVKMGPHGAEIERHNPVPPLRLLGQHFGAFSGETADRANINVDQSKNIVYIADRPPPETAEEWQARINRERGITQETAEDADA